MHPDVVLYASKVSSREQITMKLDEIDTSANFVRLLKGEQVHMTTMKSLYSDNRLGLEVHPAQFKDRSRLFKPKEYPQV